MDWTTTYTIFIVRNTAGFTAFCPAFPQHTVTATNRRAAYKAIKAAIRKGLGSYLHQESPIPRDPVVSVKHFRVNMLDIGMEVGLG
jgi:predicted RNase H-like HicB family nuclease